MRAAIYEKPNEINIVEIPVPKPAPGEALIKVHYGGICGSDIHVFNGKHPTAVFPVVPGHEFVGEIVEINGAAKQGINLGDTVVAQPYTACGSCSACITGNDNVCGQLKLLGAHRNGCFGEYVTVSTNKVYKIPDTIDKKLATLAEPLAVAVHDVRRSKLSVGQDVLIIGGGTIGLMIAIVANFAGSNVYISEVSSFRRAFAEDMGFTTLDPKSSNYHESVREITSGEGFDVVFEVSGSESGIRSTTELVKISGTIMIVGMSSKPHPVDTTTMFLKQVNVRGVRIHSQDSFAAAIGLLAGGKLNEQLKKIISGVYPLADIDKAYDYMKNNEDFFKLIVEI